MAADGLGRILFKPVWLFRKQHCADYASIREILIIRTAYVGDVVMTLPILKPLKARYPNSRITFLTSSMAAPLLQNNPFIDKILSYDPFWFYQTKKADYYQFMRRFKRMRFDLVMEARGDIREILLLAWLAKAKYRLSHGVGGGAYLLTDVVPYHGLQHKVDYHLDLVRYLGCKTVETELRIYLNQQEKEGVKALLRSHGINGPFIAAHPGSRLLLKCWPLDRCARLYSDIISDYGVPLVLLGTNSETDRIAEIVAKMNHKPFVLTGQLSLRELAAVLAESALLICNDSAPMHIAAAMKTPTVAIFGPSKSVETAPYGNLHKVVEEDFPCRVTCDESSCKHELHNACMLAVQIDQVKNAVDDLLAVIRTSEHRSDELPSGRLVS